MSTVAPAPANASAIAAPMPLLAPVTTARTPCSMGAPGSRTRSRVALRVCLLGVARGVARAAGPLGSAGERVTRLRRPVDDRLRGGLVVQRAGDRLLRGLVVPVEDLLVVGRVPVDEDADDDAEVLDLGLGDDALADRVHHGAGHARLGRPEHLHGLG